MKLYFPDLYQRWLKHDIEYCKTPVFVAIPESEREGVWKKIEENYLLKYSLIVRIEFEWGSSCIWSPPFPGSMSSGGMWEVEDFYDLPTDLKERLEAWFDFRNDNSLQHDFDFVSSNNEGLAIALAIRPYVPDDVYLEYWSFKEIKIVNGKGVELAVPDFIGKYL